MRKRFIREGREFTISEFGKGKIILTYLGIVEDPYTQCIIWPCDDEAEVESMICAVIDPTRDAAEEFNARHKEAILANCKW